MINTGTRRFVAVAAVLAAIAVLPARAEPDADAGCPEPAGENVYMSCLILGYDDEPAETGPVPQLTRLATDGVPGCVRGAQRPVVDTVTPTMSAVLVPVDREPAGATFAWEPLDGSEEQVVSRRPVFPGGVVILETAENGLAPGQSYRWRVTGASGDATAPGWSEWCEFTVAAGLTDMRGASDIEAVRELGVAPDRRYRVTLTARQWLLIADTLDRGVPVAEDAFSEEDAEAADRLLRMAADMRNAAAGGRAAVTLTGDQWATVARAVAETAYAWDQLDEEEPEAGRNGAAYWKALDRISAAVGGPERAGLGYER